MKRTYRTAVNEQKIANLETKIINRSDRGK